MTKKMRRLFSLMLAVVMVFAMTITAFADEPKTPTISVKSGDTHTYEVYQIFTGDVSGQTLSNVKWGKNGTGTKGQKVDESILTELQNANTAENATDTTKLAVIQKYANLTAANKFGSVSASQNLTVPTGYYLLKDTDKSLEGKEDSYTKYIVKVVNDVEVERKADVPESEKKVKDINDSTDTQESEWQDSADHDIDDEINYQIKATLPDNVSAYKSYYLAFVDTMSKGLTYVDGSAVVKVNGTQVAKLEPTPSDYYGNDAKYTGGTVLRWNIADVKVAPYSASDNAVITIEYKAKLNDKAVLGSAGNPNKMHIEFSNNPNAEGDGEKGKTPDDTNIVFTYKTVVKKITSDKKALAGAEFTLEKKQADGTWKAITVVKNDAGTTFTFNGLDDGNYRLTETKTPDGYNTIDPIYFTITAEHNVLSENPALTKLEGKQKDGDTFAADKKNGLAFTPSVSEGSLTADVVNNKGSELPSTGGIGTTIFYIIGVILVLGAGVVLVTRRKMNA